MIANLITLFRLILVFVVISLFGQHLYLDILLVALIGLILFLDAVDGYVARKLNQTSDFGALLDIVGDRIVECIFWVYFAVVGLIPIWIPVIVIARGFFTDGLRSAAFAQGKTAFGENTMMSSRWTRALTSSRISRSIYGIAKTIAFPLSRWPHSLQKFGRLPGIDCRFGIDRCDFINHNRCDVLNSRAPCLD